MGSLVSRAKSQRRVFVLALAFAGSLASGAHAQYGATDGQWPSYGGDWGSTKYSPLDQINAENVKNLQVKWSWTAPRNSITNEAPVRELQATPMYVDGMLITGTGLDQVASLDPATGEQKWIFEAPEMGGSPARTRSYGKGPAYWKVGDQGRIYLAATRNFLYCLDAKTGQLVPDFGEGGKVDLRLGLERTVTSYGTVSPPVICRDTVVVGCVVGDGPSPAGTPGHIRGYDAKTGKMKWIFHSIPQPGEEGYETWPPEAWKTVGAANVWSLMSADQELGYVYLPLTTPSNDFYGGARHGDNLFAESLVCLDAETGKKVWHFQAVHHGLWDYDFPAAPTLLDITVDGQKIKAVAQISKQGFCYVFDRVTGKPVWPIEEKAVPQTTVPGEQTSPTQPHPTKPPAFERQGTSEDMLIDFTPELKAEALVLFKKYTSGPLFTPGSVITPENKGTLANPGHGGGGNWSGAAADPETGMLYVPSVFTPIVIGLSGGSRGGGPVNYSRTGETYPPGPDGLPLFKPPYGQITAYDLNKGEIVWQKANGLGLATIRDHPRLAGLDLPPLGQHGRIGPLLTKTLLFVGEGGGLSGATSGAGGPIFRAYDKKTGAIISELTMPANTVGTPMTYMHGGKQYIVQSIGSRQMTGTICAVALP